MLNVENTTKKSFFEELSIDHGPRELFVRFFIKAVEALKARGIELEFSDFETLHKVNSENRDSWRPLLASFQPGLGGANASNGFVFVGRNAEGEVVGTQAIRLFDWSESNLKKEAEALRLLYKDPEKDCLPGEQCMVSAGNAEEITGLVGVGGAVWYRPDYRRRQLAEIIPRMARAYAFTRYNATNVVAIFSPDNVQKGVHKIVGFRDATEGLTMKNSRSFPNGEVKMLLCRQQQMDIIDDTFQFLIDWQPKVDGGVQKRRA